jgi:hypothetical protein
MHVTTEVYRLKGFLAEVIAIADAERDRRESPRRDRLTQRQAYREFGEAEIKSMFEAGLIRRERLGSRKNSPAHYSRVEILMAIAARRAVREDILRV